MCCAYFILCLLCSMLCLFYIVPILKLYYAYVIIVPILHLYYAYVIVVAYGVNINYCYYNCYFIATGDQHRVAL